MNKIFSKDKDWVLLIGYVGLIYSTLQFMPKVNSFFSSLLGRYPGIIASILVGIIITVIFIIVLKRNSRRQNPVFYISVIAVFGSYMAIIFLATPIVAEKMHLLEYGFLSYLVLRVLKGTQPSWKQSLYVILIVIIVGSLDELIQGFTPGRYYEMKDVALNIVSGVLGLFVLKLFKPEHC